MQVEIEKRADQDRSSEKAVRSSRGFSLIECVVAMLILMVAALAVITVFDFAFRSNGDAKKRYVALLLAQRRMEDVRNSSFSSLTAGTVTDTLMDDGINYTVTRTIVDNDVNTAATAPGPETKKITITVTPQVGQFITDSVTLTNYRMVVRPGPNRTPNP